MTDDASISMPPQVNEFWSIHRHGLVRVGVAKPRVRTADVEFNREAVLGQARAADAESVDLLVFPELGISSYAIDDLHMQSALLDAVEHAISEITRASTNLSCVMLLGAPLRHRGRLYNCAVVVSKGEILGVAPKSYLPNYREYYEKRWFAPGRAVRGETIGVGGMTVPFGSDLVFDAKDLPGFVFHVEICEDFWGPLPPSTFAALSGATILANLSASNITIGKSDERHMLCKSQSARAVAAYVYCAAGPGESTTDLAWDGQAIVYELGDLLAESERFVAEDQLTIVDVDTQRILAERLRMQTFGDTADEAADSVARFRRVHFDHAPSRADLGLMREVRRFPYVPNRRSHLDHDCYEAFNIQVEGLYRRFQATGGKHMVIGVSGGLDSTHALIVAAKACDKLDLPRSRILGFTMPGFATSDKTRDNAWKLMNTLGVTGEEIDIRPAARQMLEDMGHPFARGEEVYDVAFENVQAGLRTDYLFRLANQRQGFVVGTGDLSEMALGWCTYGVGDQMSHYAVNIGVPKTLIQYLIRWCERTSQFDEATNRVLEEILAMEISPELIPAGSEEEMQSTEGVIGPYELHDFFLYHIMRFGLPPSKVAFLAWHAWNNANEGLWPIEFPEHARNEYDLASIRKWLEVFLQRFFAFSQFKRSALPNGPKVSNGGALSPRGDWRAPSDATASPWLDELRRNVPSE